MNSSLISLFLYIYYLILNQYQTIRYIMFHGDNLMYQRSSAEWRKNYFCKYFRGLEIFLPSDEKIFLKNSYGSSGEPPINKPTQVLLLVRRNCLACTHLKHNSWRRLVKFLVRKYLKIKYFSIEQALQ